VDDTQRRVLAERLRAGPIARLERLRRPARDRPADPFDAEIDRIIDDLHRMAQGLNPAALADGRPLRAALHELARRTDVAVDCDIAANLDGLPEETVALVYYTASECLTNVARTRTPPPPGCGCAVARPSSSRSTTTAAVAPRPNPGGGLQGLADRIAVVGGTVRIDSPVGGPTSVRVEVPGRPAATAAPPDHLAPPAPVPRKGG
jgi:signal transduction histidine kinase